MRVAALVAFLFSRMGNFCRFSNVSDDLSGSMPVTKPCFTVDLKTCREAQPQVQPFKFSSCGRFADATSGLPQPLLSHSLG